MARTRDRAPVGTRPTGHKPRRFVIADHSLFARPDGGRLSKWVVLDTQRRCRLNAIGIVVGVHGSRKEARDDARGRNAAELTRGDR